MSTYPLLAGYPDEPVAQAQAGIADGTALAWIAERYPERHKISSNQELFAYAQELKMRHFKNAPQLSKVQFDKNPRSAHKALGQHDKDLNASDKRLVKSREVRISGLFRAAPAAFLRLMVVHELAHQKYAEHDHDFYRMCSHIEPDYDEVEFDLRVYLSALERKTPRLEPLP